MMREEGWSFSLGLRGWRGSWGCSRVGAERPRWDARCGEVSRPDLSAVLYYGQDAKLSASCFQGLSAP